MKAKAHSVWLVLLLVLAFVAACNDREAPILPSSSQDFVGVSATGSFIAAPVAQSIPSSLSLINLPSVADIVVATRPSVVNVTAQVESGSSFFRSRGATSTGTGAIIHSDGYVVTNYHVIRGASRIQITTDDGRVFRASVEGSDPITDLAVLRIEGDGPFPALPFAAPNSFRVGDWAIAIGNALGLPGGPSVTLGVVGALDRSLTTREQTLTDLIQTDAAINEGNSGGPLVNLNGEIIGINTAVVRGAQGIGFSVSSFTVIPVVQSILKHGRVMWPWLGVGVQDVTAPLALELDLDGRQGVLMQRIWPDSPAEAAGIQEGDVLLSIDGNPINSLRALQRVMREQLEVGQEIQARFFRDGELVEFTISLEEMPRQVVHFSK
jgi:S1-C subfamily serine protease